MLRPSPQGRVDGVTWDVSPMAEFTGNPDIANMPWDKNECEFNHYPH
jgi:hypothetical protein